MLKGISLKWLLGGWFAVVAVIVASSAAMNARLSTSALLFLMGMAPVAVMVFIGLGGPSPTVAEILHSVDAQDGRS